MIDGFFVPCNNPYGVVGVGNTDSIPYTLTIDTELIKLKHKEMDIEFNLKPDKLKNIDTIIINGYKYKKVN